MFAWFAGLPLIGKLFSWVSGSLWPKAKEKHRLLIEYALVAVVIVVATSCVTLWLKHNSAAAKLEQANEQIAALRGRVTTVEAVNSAQEATIGNLRTLRQQDQLALGGMLEDQKRLHDLDLSERKRIQQLEASNAKVRSYLDEPIPDDLKRMLH